MIIYKNDNESVLYIYLELNHLVEINSIMQVI